MPASAHDNAAPQAVLGREQVSAARPAALVSPPQLAEIVPPPSATSPNVPSAPVAGIGPRRLRLLMNASQRRGPP